MRHMYAGGELIPTHQLTKKNPKQHLADVTVASFSHRRLYKKF